MSISHADLAYNRPGSLRDAAVAGWFLGPKGENKELLSDLFTQALDEHVSFRNQYFPEDPYYITDEVKEQPAYEAAVAKLRDESQKLFQRLKNSVPFYSMRYQGHMLWDITMPGMVGYHAAMFYNQNNTAVEASPVTTALEYRVGFDLAKMLGYQVGDSIDGSSGLPQAGPKSSHLEEAALAPEKTPQPWGHVTCDGSVANLESLWAARNLKYFPLSFQMALKNPALASASNFTVPVWDIATGKKKNRKVLSLSTWELLNLDVDDVLALTDRLSSAPYNISSQIISDAMAPFNIQYAGISELHRLFGIRKTPVYIVTQSCHYSWPKAGSVLGLGMNNMIKIPVDKKGRMDMNSLHKTLTDLVSPADPADRTAVIMVMGIAGSTEESCVDPIADILSMRKEFQTKLGFSYYVHCDGAWGGYFCSTMRKDDSSPPQVTDHIESFLHACNDGEGSSSSAHAAGYVPFLPLSRYTETQLNALCHCDSITIDPHKSGYIQYPAGGLVYRNGTTRTLITFDAPIVYKGQGDQTIGIYGIEGSKPGAAAAACYLSHRVIGLNRNGYGRILGQANFSTKKMYCMLNTLAQDDDPFIIRTFTDFPKPLVDDHGSVRGLLEYLQKHVVDRTNSQIAQDSRAMETMRQLGPDLLINAFAINFKVPAPSSDGEASSMHHMSNGDSSMDMSCGPSHLVLNRDIDKANAVMTNLFNDLDMAYMVLDPDGGPAAPIQKYGVMRKPLFFTSSEFGSNKYGMAVDDLKKRLGFDPEEDTPLYFLVNTTMDPWQTSVQFTKMVARILRANILKSIGTVTDTPDTHGFLLVGQKTLYFKHFPMFCAPPHQYMITIRVDFSNDADRQKYLDKQKEDPNKVLVLANHDESILHDIVYRDPTSPLPVDCYFGMPPTGPPTVPFMEAALLIKDFIIYEHFDVKAQYPERLTYLMYGTGDEVHIEHYITKMKSFDHVCTLAAPPCGIDEERFKAGMFIQFNKPDGYYTENPLKEHDEWEFTYAGDGGVELNSKLTIARHVWFDPNRVNVMD